MARGRVRGRVRGSRTLPVESGREAIAFRLTLIPTLAPDLIPTLAPTLAPGLTAALAAAGSRPEGGEAAANRLGHRANMLVSPSQLAPSQPAGAVPPHQFPAPAPLARHCPLSRRYRLRSMISTSAPDVPREPHSHHRRRGARAPRRRAPLNCWTRCSAAVQQQTEHHVVAWPRRHRTR